MTTVSMRSWVGLAAVAALALTGCTSANSGTGQSQGESGPAQSGSASALAADPQAFPVTIPSALGDAVIDSEPERVVTWGWGAADAVLALGVVPVAIPAQTYGGNAEGVLPWIEEELSNLGAPTPTILPSDSGEAPIEAIAAADPDVIIAPYSGLTQEEFTQLSAIAPVVAYPETAWSTPWRDVISITGQALGRSAQGEVVLASIDAQLDRAAAEHPEFAGVSIAQVWDTGETFFVYLPADPRVQFLEALGFVTSDAVSSLDTGEATFYYTLSYERLDELTSDVLVMYGDSNEQIDEFTSSARGSLLPQVSGGHVARIIGQAQIAAVSPPTALSLPWGMDEAVEALSTAVATAK